MSIDASFHVRKRLFCRLTPFKDVGKSKEFFEASSPDPWLKMEFEGPAPRGRWVRISYLGGFYDELVRPLIRIVVGEKIQEEILPGPLLGRGIWIGVIPKDAKEILISPTNRPGPFAFAIESVEIISTPEIVGRSLLQSPVGGLRGLGAYLIGLKYASYREFRRILAATDLNNYEVWKRRRLRKLDVDDLDRPRFDWRTGPIVWFVLASRTPPQAQLEALARQLSKQVYPRWRLLARAEAIAEGDSADWQDAGGRIVYDGEQMTVKRLREIAAGEDLLIFADPEDEFPDYACAVIAEAAMSNPEARLFYGDVEYRASGGDALAPRLFPDWSPVFDAQSRYLADSVKIWAVRALKGSPDDMAASDFVNASKLRSGETGGDVKHIRRILLSRRQDIKDRPRSTQKAVHCASNDSRAQDDLVSIIIPTRDRIDLLRDCLDSLKSKTMLADYEVIVVDNGSRLSESGEFFAAIDRDSRVRVISRPGPFNFSKLCNDAAAESAGSTLVFLNNDTRIVNGDWLEDLIFWTGLPDVGAVGAKLLYPDGRLQHSGVVLGIDGWAGHLERKSSADDPGYFGQNMVPHEVSAVTAACMAVQRRKFEAVGGFDADHLPVDLNDIDLCLRLAERGWKSLCAPKSVVIHIELATRGKKIRAEEVYFAERDFFRRKWMHRLRDDPYFHPALSLDRTDVALG